MTETRPDEEIVTLMRRVSELTLQVQALRVERDGARRLVIQMAAWLVWCGDKINATRMPKLSREDLAEQCRIMAPEWSYLFEKGGKP